MWSALEHFGLRRSLPAPLQSGDRVHDILVAGQLEQTDHTLRHLGRRRSKPYLLQQFYSINTDAFLRWQGAARFLDVAPVHGFAWLCEEWRGGLIAPMPDGVPLTKWLISEPPLTDRLAAAERLARRVATLHAAGIVHRNLSPSAIWAGNGTLDLGGVGTAKTPWWDDLWTDSIFSANDPVIASPEALAGEPLTAAHDVYGYGIILHLLLTRQPAFSFFRRCIRQLAPSMVLPNRLMASPRISSELKELRDACLSATPENRPSTAEVATILAPYAGGTPFTQEPITPPAKPTQPGGQRVMVFVSADTQAVPIFDHVLASDETESAAFLFISLIPANLPSGHLELFKGALFRKLGQGLLRCRARGVRWSLRVLETMDPEKTADILVREYAPDAIYKGGSAGKKRMRQTMGRTLRRTGVPLREID